MKRIVKPSRIIFIFVVLAFLLSLYGSTLYKLQVIDGAEYYDEMSDTYKTSYPVSAARGEIFDRNGRLLVSSETVNNISLSRKAILRSGNPNENILGILNTAEEFREEHEDTFPITMTGPFEYLADMTQTQSSRLAAYLEFFDLDPEISASDLIIWLKNHYGIGYTTPLYDARRIIGIRYELELRVVIVNIPDYVFAADVNVDFISALKERGYAGVRVSTSAKRVYHTKSAAHLLGYTGLMDKTEYEKYKEFGYPMDAVIGQDGVESAFEEYLHGEDGAMTVTTNSSGAVLSVETTKEAKAGSNVYLSLDIKMQAVAETALSETIAAINAERMSKEEETEPAEGGAVVVIDVNTGQTLTSASYPSYDISNFLRDYSTLESDGLQPLFNRATMGKYNPGSTFKMVTALAALNNGVITPGTLIQDLGKYTKYSTFQPSCYLYPYGDHGKIDVCGAIEKSCNYFFYVIGDKLGINAIANTARQFGFGTKTGIEISESDGTLATPAYKQSALGEGWWAADTLITSIGQGHNLFTPVQIANYVATIANGGKNYKTTLLDAVVANDFTTVVKESEPEIKNIINDPNGYLGVLKNGMRAVAKTGTASSVFRSYAVPVAAKTGTVQSDTKAANTAVFVCYAPADDPQIAISVVVENGGSGSSIMSVAKAVLDCWFGGSEEAEILIENALVK